MYSVHPDCSYKVFCSLRQRLSLERLWWWCCLVGGRGADDGGVGGGVDVGAEEGLAEDGQDAALGLLAGSGADVDELVGAGGGGGSWGGCQF